MILLGLTGSIGMGKSATAAMFRDAGAPVYDADGAVHRLYAGPAVAAVGKEFPSAIVDGRVDRSLLSQQVIDNPKALSLLESIVHPMVAADRIRFLEACASQARPLCVLDVPLLFETGGDRSVDVVVVVSTDSDTQEKRVLARPGMEREKFMAIKAKQMPDADKRRRAHAVIDTSHGFDYARRQVAQILISLGA
jgi:dephospho-CoA kinase